MLQVIASGMALGSIYALVAVGFSMTWVTTQTLNFAQGELVMIGAFVGLALHVDWGWSLVAAMPVAVLVGVVLGMLIGRLVVAPFAKGAAAIGWILSTVAVSIVLRNAGELIWGREARRSPSPVGEKLIEVGGVRLQPQQVLILVALVVIVLVLSGFLGATMWGKALSAVAQNRDAAALAGIPPTVVAAMSYGLSGGLAAAAGLLVAPVTFVSAYMGFALVIKSFAVAVVAGLTSFRGVVVTGLVFGAAEALVARYQGPEYRNIFGLTLIIAVLALRPTGVFGKRQVVKV